MAKKTTKPEVDLSNFEDLFQEIVTRVADATGVSAPADLTLPSNPVTPGERVLNATDWAEKMTSRAVNASSDWLKGVLHPRKNPVLAAIAANGKRKERLAEAEREERYLHAMERVDVDEMYKVIEKSEGVYRNAIEARKAKIANKVAKLQPLVSALAQTIDKMPQDSDANREARMVAARRGMIKIGSAMKGITPK